MASIKQLSDRRYKITISNGYRNGKKICKSQTIQVPKSVASRSIRQYIMHEAEELERRFKYGFSEDGSTTFQDYAESWLSRQSKYAPSTLASYRRQLEVVYPYIGAIPLCKLRPLAIENMLTQLRKRKSRSGQPIQETTVQHYLSAVSAVLSDAKRNEIIQKNPARMIDLPTASHTDQHIPTVEEAQHLLQALAREPRHFRVFYLLAMATGCRRGELCALRWSDFRTSGNGFILTVSRSRSIVAGKGVVEGSTKNGHSRQIILSPALRGVLLSYRWRLTQEAARQGMAGSSVRICSLTRMGHSSTPTHSRNVCKRSTPPTASLLSITCTPCATSLSPRCCTAASISRRWRSWPVTATPAFWNAPTAIRNYPASRKPPRPCSLHCIPAAV